MSIISKLFGVSNEAQIKKIRPVVEQVNALEPSVSALSDAQLREKTEEFKNRFAAGETLEALLVEAFAVVREAAKRTVDMRPYDVQLIGGAVLHQGRIAEMKTGEGKTLVATLPSYLNAISGKGVHVVTVNDYLAKRDAEWMGKVHRFLGLSVGVILSQMDPDDRRKAYACDITYGTNSEFGFDYLRDNMVVYKEHMVQRELNYAIVDEVDSILIDEARTPLIISGQGEASTELYEKANRFIRGLKRGQDVVEQSKLDSMLDRESAFDNDGDFTVDEKHKTVMLTASGVDKAERFFNVEKLTDAGNTELNHHIQQALKANALFKLDRDYVVQNGEVLIVDEFTGRLMVGRRYSEGLHQAIEAKEGVKVAHESKTLATVTYQNYFRMYKKLAGMTGTAKTEEAEFQGIYKLDVVEIPTNRKNIRKDFDDLIFLNERSKFNAVIKEIVTQHATGRPVLVGTVSVEKSELLAAMLSRQGVKHEVLNAKFHAKEAEIVAQAGKFNAVTIATNMAGRGTDILLGGNPDFLARRALRQQGLEDELIEEATGHAETNDEAVLAARIEYKKQYDAFKKSTDAEHEKVVAAGGLHIIGTERHEARRIDNQLRGRCGRQGDPGSTRFYLSLEDDLLRLFGGENLKNLTARIGAGLEDTPMELGILTKQIELAQKRVESMHFSSRKHVLQYDDVMNQQREIIYGQRRRVLMGEDVGQSIAEMLHDLIVAEAADYCVDGTYPESWDLKALCKRFEMMFMLPGENPFAELNDRELDKLKKDDVAKLLNDIAEKRYAQKVDELGASGVNMRDVEREILLRVVDMHWTDHIDAMDQLREGIQLQAYGQRDPVVEYRLQGFEMFDDLVNSIREQTLTALYHVSLSSVPHERKQTTRIRALGTERANKPKMQTNSTSSEAPKPHKSDKKVGRNDPCTCGSGKKYKNCCGKGELG